MWKKSVGSYNSRKEEEEEAQGGGGGREGYDERMQKREQEVRKMKESGERTQRKGRWGAVGGWMHNVFVSTWNPGKSGESKNQPEKPPVMLLNGIKHGNLEKGKC